MAFNRYKTNVTGFETIAQKGKRFIPRFFSQMKPPRGHTP